jgi:AcrR family transcriptional regulator
MTSDTTDRSDPQRSLERLWGRQEPGRRGPKQSLSTPEVVDMAVALADKEGVQALSMRKVAEAVGVSPMSLYTYVPSKSELLDLMFDRVLGGAADPDEAVVGWREQLAFMARERWALSERHSWLLDLPAHRPPLGPNMMRKAMAMLSAVATMGLTPQETRLAADLLQDYITGALRSAREAREAEQLSGLSDEQWFSIVWPALEKHLDPQHRQTVEAMSKERRQSELSPDARTARFEFGLQRVLDGLEVFIRERRAADQAGRSR